jgi:hypothetical protein
VFSWSHAAAVTSTSSPVLLADVLLHAGRCEAAVAVLLSAGTVDDAMLILEVIASAADGSHRSSSDTRSPAMLQDRRAFIESCVRSQTKHVAAVPASHTLACMHQAVFRMAFEHGLANNYATMIESALQCVPASCSALSLVAHLHPHSACESGGSFTAPLC